MNKNTLVVNDINIQDKIYNIRGLQVMLDRDLADLYGVETKTFNQSVKRNIKRFPTKFRFQLTENEYKILRSQIVTLSSNNSLRSQNVTLESQKGKHPKYLPSVFTEQGVSMISAILKSDIAIDISIKIMDSFVSMRKLINSNDFYIQQLKELEKRQLTYEIKSDEKFDNIFNALEDKKLKPTHGIFYDGQVFDAYKFVSDLIRDAKSSIILIDNYCDDSVLTLFSKNQDIDVTIYTHTISKQLKQDLDKYNAQYKPITIKSFKDSHDRFMIIDKKDIYHIGASLKDLGKKWFAFSKIGLDVGDILNKLK